MKDTLSKKRRSSPPHNERSVPSMPATAAKKAPIPTAVPASRRVLVEFPEPLLEKASELAGEKGTNRSRLIRKALEQYVRFHEQEKLKRELAEAYAQNSDVSLLVSGWFRGTEDDVL
jgi:hypothetical protein